MHKSITSVGWNSQWTADAVGKQSKEAASAYYVNGMMLSNTSKTRK